MSLLAERRLVSYHSIAAIPFAGLQRPLDERTVKLLAAELADTVRNGSAPDSGFSHPIELAELPEEERPEPNKLYRVVAGFHRFEAWLVASGYRLRGETDMERLTCTVYVNASPAQIEYLHVRENVRRADLPPEQRLAWAAKLAAMQLYESSDETFRRIVGRNWRRPAKGASGPKSEKGADGPKSSAGRKASWFLEWHEAAGIPETTAKRLWRDFAAEGGIAGVAPGAAGRGHRAAFAAWLKARGAADAAEARRRAEEAEARQKAEDRARHASRVLSDFAAYRARFGDEAADTLLAELTAGRGR